MIIKKPLPGIVSTSYRCRHVCRQLLGPSASAPSALHFSSVNDAVVPDTHDTVSHDESMSDGPLSFRLFILLLICPYQLPPTPYSRQLFFMLTVYGVFPSVVYVLLI